MEQEVYDRQNLLYAVESGNINRIKRILSTGIISPDRFYWDNHSLLGIAIKAGNYQVLKTLVDYGADLSLATPKERGIAISLCILNNDAQLMLKLVRQEDTDINAPDSLDRTPLSYAIDRDNAKVVKFLLKNGAKTDTWTNLECAIMSGKFEAGRALIASGEEINQSVVYWTLVKANLRTKAGNLVKKEKLYEYLVDKFALKAETSRDKEVYDFNYSALFHHDPFFEADEGEEFFKYLVSALEKRASKEKDNIETETSQNS